MKVQSVSKLTHLGLFAALIFVATYLLKITMPIGYIHLGDGMILAGATLLGPAAWLPAAIGSAMADVMLAYTSYALPTFLIKGLVGFLAGLFLQKIHQVKGAIGIFILVELLMVAGYFVTEAFMYGFNGAIPQLPANLLQGASGVVIGAVLFPSIVLLRQRYQSRQR